MRRACTLPALVQIHHMAPLPDLRPPRADLREPAREPPRFGVVPRLPLRAPPFSPRRDVVLERRFEPPLFPPRLPACISSPIKLLVVLFAPRGIECLLRFEELFQPGLYAKAPANRRA